MDQKITKFMKVIKIINIMFIATETYLRARKLLRRRRCVRPVNINKEKNINRHNLGIQRIAFTHLKLKNEEHFFKATRMTMDNFNALLILLKGRLEKFSRRKPIDEETRLGLTLLYLADGCSIKFLAWTYEMGVSTVRKIIYETCDAIWSELHEMYVSQPYYQEWNSIADRFYVKTGMPHCLGAIGGKHFNIVCPKNSGSLSYNYKKSFSIVLMAVCDADYNFMFVDVGAFDSQSDVGVFDRSSFAKMILRNQINLPPDAKLPGSDVSFPYFFVGNNAFPLKQNLMRPYPGRNLTAVKQQFNKKLSAARVYIENTFGILTNRWKILQSNIRASPKNADKIVLATVALHNYLMLDKSNGYFDESLVDHEENGIIIPGLWRQSSESQPSFHISHANHSSKIAFDMRDELANHLFQN